MKTDMNNRPGDYSGYLSFDAGEKITLRNLELSFQDRLPLYCHRDFFDITGTEEIADTAAEYLPVIKRIFAKPVIRLREGSELLPVESVHIINHKTVAHIAGHPRLWKGVDEQGITPEKLLTVRYEDEYGIYENLVFVSLVDRILAFLAGNIRIIRQILVGEDAMTMGFLSHSYHRQFFMALGKLHTGYAVGSEDDRENLEKLCDKLLFLQKTIQSRLNSPLYKHCTGKGGKLRLNKTNVFRNHKDYRRIYQLALLFREKMPQTEEPDNHGGYIRFAFFLSLFAAMHFSFRFADDEQIDFGAPACHGKNGNVSLTISEVDTGCGRAVRMDFHKEIGYSILLTDAPITPAIKNLADEAVYIGDGQGDVEISRYQPRSFARIQQMILRGMICCDQKRDVCPFCGHKLTYGENGFVCSTCHIHIRGRICPTARKRYFSTGFARDFGRSGEFEREGLCYRAITEIAPDGKAVCPYCRRVHPEDV